MKPKSSRASQWSFAFPSHSTESVERLQKLPEDKVVYSVFAVRKDDTGRSFLQGFIKFTWRVRVSALTRLIGYQIFSTCPTNTSIKDAISEIKMWTFWEAGDANWTSQQDIRNDLIAFKEAADAGAPLETLESLHPKIFEKFPGFVQSHVISKRFPTPMETDDILRKAARSN